MHPTKILIGTRYLRSTQRRGFLSFISVVSMLGLALGVAVLIVVLSVMNGFERELRTRILSVTSHATLMGLEGTLARLARRAARGAEAIPRSGGGALHRGAGDADARRALGPDAVRGVLPEQERRAVGLAQRIRAARIEDLQPGSYRIVLGDALAEALGVKMGDDVVLIAPRGSVTPAGIRAAHAPLSRSAACSIPACTSTTARWRWRLCRMPRASTGWAIR